MRTARLRGLALLASLLAAGCSAHMVETHGDKVSLFKTGLEKPGRGGAVRYLRNGPGAFRRARRADAERRMRAFCGGDFAITAEGPRSKLGASAPVGDKVTLELDEYQYVVFECPGAAAAPSLIR